MSIKDAIDIHKCIEWIDKSRKMTNSIFTSTQEGNIQISYDINRDSSIDIYRVYFNNKENIYYKHKLQEYFNINKK